MSPATSAVSAQREPELLGQTVVVIGGSARRAARSEARQSVYVGGTEAN